MDSSFLSNQQPELYPETSFEMLWNGEYTPVDCLQGYNLMTQAVASGHTGIVHSLVVDYRANIQKVDERGMDALYTATVTNQPHMVAKLLQWGANTNTFCTPHQWTPAMVAAHMGHDTVLKLLLEEPTSQPTMASPKTGETALHCAAKANRDTCVQLLLEEQQHDVWTTTQEGYTALDVATMQGHVKIVDLILACTQDTPRLCRLSRALYLAVLHDKVWVGQRLMKAGASCLYPGASANGDTPTPLLAAIQRDNADMVTLCIHFGYLRTVYDTSMIKYAATVQKAFTVINRVNRMFTNNHTISDPHKLLAEAVERGDVMWFKFLMKHAPLDPAICDKDGFFHKAVSRGNDEMVEALAGMGLSLNKAGPRGLTPLYMATSANNLTMVQRLIACGADVNSQDHPNQLTPLFLASCVGNTSITKALLHAGADPLLPTGPVIQYKHAYDAAKAQKFQGSQRCAQLMDTYLDMQEDRVALLIKGRMFHDMHQTNDSILETGSGRTRGQKKRKYTPCVPACMLHRFDKNKRLPSMSLRTDNDNDKSFQLSQVTKHVIRGALSQDLFQELISFLP